MQILTKKRYQFTNGEEKVVTQGNFVVENVPDWVKKDDFFKMAVDDGDILVLEGKGKVVDAKVAAALAEAEAGKIPTEPEKAKK